MQVSSQTKVQSFLLNLNLLINTAALVGRTQRKLTQDSLAAPTMGMGGGYGYYVRNGNEVHNYKAVFWE